MSQKIHNDYISQNWVRWLKNFCCGWDGLIRIAGYFTLVRFLVWIFTL